jgi:hypothetical protein
MKINTAEFIISNSDVVNVPKTFTWICFYR